MLRNRIVRACALATLSSVAVLTQPLASLTPPPQEWVPRFFPGGGSLWTPNAVPLALPSAFTIEGWFFVDEVVPGGANVLVLAEPGPAAWIVSLGTTPDGKWNVHTAGGGLPGPNVMTTAWTHIAFRTTGSTSSLFFNGVKHGDNSIGAFTLPNADILLGNFAGALRQVRIWGSALSDSEIAAVAVTAPSPGDARLLAWWPLDDAADVGLLQDRVRDVSANGHDLAISDRDQFIGPQGRWVRASVLASGPYFRSRPLVPAGVAFPNQAGVLFPRFIDADRDGDLDIYSVHRMNSPCAPLGVFPYFTGDPPQPDRLFRNDGSGPFVDASDEFLLGERIQGFLVHFVGVYDFTGDGLDDIFVADNGPECAGTLQAYAYPNSIRVGTASGNLDNESATRLPQTPDADHRAAAADLDGDGDLDVVGFGVGFPNPYFINNGSGVFTRKFLTWSPSDADTSVATIDADLDGDIDLFVGDNANTLHNTLLLNNGKAAFTVAPQGWLPRKNRGQDYVVVHAMVPVDIDGDGILDIVASEQPPPTAGTPESPFLQLLLGNGDGTFRDASARLGAQDWPEGLTGQSFGAGLFYFEPFDQNADGWIDLAVPSVGVTYPNLATLLINRGTAGFEEAGDLLPSSRQNSFVDFGDADGDGDVDLVFDDVYFENLKPYAPNTFPATNLDLALAVKEAGSAITLVATVRNSAAAAAPAVNLAVPVPHGFQHQSTNGGGGSCSLQGHVVLCTRALLEASGEWIVAVSAAKGGNAPIPSTHAVASVTANILDPDRSDNVSRVELPGQAPIPPGPWLATNAVPGFEFKVTITSGGGTINGKLEKACIVETLCVSGAIAGRSEIFVRIVGPKPNGYLWPTLVKFSTSEVRVWVRQVATNTIKAYVLAGAGPTSSDLSGSFDRLGFLPPGKQQQQLQQQPVATEADPGARIATDHADPLPPGNNWLTTPEVPGFRFQVRITAGGPPFLGAKVNACIEETLCVSGAIAGRPEVFARVVGPKPNGYLWPTIVKFTTSQLEVWVEQTKTGIVKYYLLAGAGPTSSDLPGFFDRTGFQP